MVKLIDIKTDVKSSWCCGVCGRKIKNAYICDDGVILGSECIIKHLGEGLQISEDLRVLNYKLKQLKYILNSCGAVRVSKEIELIKTKEEFKTYYAVWLYDSFDSVQNVNKCNINNFSSFKYRLILKDFLPLISYFQKNSNIKYFLELEDGLNLKEINLSEVLK